MGAGSTDPVGYWAAESSRIAWDEPAEAVFDDRSGPYGRWFPGGRMNTSYNCLDRHVEAGTRPGALVWDSAMTGERATLTYRELRDRVAKWPGPWPRWVSTTGDRVIDLHADGPGGRDRDAGLRQARRRPLGRLRWLRRLRARGADRRHSPRAVIAASCGLEPGRVVAYKPVLDAALEPGTHTPGRVLRAAAPAARAPPCGRAVTTTCWRPRRPRAPRAGTRSGHRSALHPAHLRYDRTTQGNRA